MKLFLYEFAAAREDEELPASVRREGKAMLAALAEDARRLGAEVLRLAPCRRGEAERSAFQALAAAADGCLLIAPEFDGLLEERARWVGEAGGRLWSCGPAGVAAVADKLALARRWEAAGVPTPQSWLPAEPPRAPLPWVRKWRVGAGSQEMKLLRRAEPLPAGPGWLLQEFRPGLPASLAFLCGRRGFRLPLLPATQRLTADGSFQYLGGTLPAPPELHERLRRLAERALAAAEAPGLFGYVGVDLILGQAADGSEDRAIELNPRLTTSYLGLRRMTETNLLELWLRVAAGEEPEPPEWKGGPLDFGPDPLAEPGAAKSRNLVCE